MNRLQPIAPSPSRPPFTAALLRVWQTLRRAVSAWFFEDSPSSLEAASRPASVVICYHCRRRVSAEEIRTGLHDHPKAASAAAGQHAQEQ